MSTPIQVVHAWRAHIDQQLGGRRRPTVAVVLGSGLGAIAECIENPLVVPYDSLDGFPESTVPGHAGRLSIGTLAGVMTACLQGRRHAYEGGDASHLALPVRLLKALGCHTLLLTNAAGGLTRQLAPGSLMLIRDHINWAGVNPLVGDNDDALGPRFVDMTYAYDADLRSSIRAVADARGIALAEGVYVMAHGPAFETPAEVQALARLGGDAVGMSTVPECLVARHCSMRVAGLTLITNRGAGLADGPLTHEDTLAQASKTANTVRGLLLAIMPSLARSD